MKTAEQIRQCKKSSLEIIMAAIEQAAENGEDSLDLFKWHSGAPGVGGYYKRPFAYTNSDLETLKSRGFEIVEYDDWNSGIPVFCYLFEWAKGYYIKRYTISWAHVEGLI
jgi:hypothetical protein